MPLMNGHTNTGAHQLMRGEKVLDHADALRVLEKEYTERDGIDAKTLLDSKAHGGLTYNDFLVLPGYIGMLALATLQAQKS